MGDSGSPQTVGNGPSGSSKRQKDVRRGLLLAGLIVALGLVALGSDLVAAHLNQAPHLRVHINTQAALFDTSPDSGVPSATATPTPKSTAAPDCHCSASKSTLEACQTPSQGGQVIVVCKSKQWLYAYQDGKLLFNTPVETGRPELPTPTGVFSIFYKNCSDKEWLSNSYNQGVHNANCAEHNGDGYVEQFTSPFPPGSPDWYYPTSINYAMEFADGGFFLHDAWWHCDFGPGSNIYHYTSGCPGFGDGGPHYETGSHGCVGLPVSSAAWLYAWSRIGTTVIVTN